MQLYGKICSLLLLLAWCSVAFSLVAPNIQVCPNNEEFSFSFECQPSCAVKVCNNGPGSRIGDRCTCKAGYTRQFDGGPCIRVTACPA